MRGKRQGFNDNRLSICLFVLASSLFRKKLISQIKPGALKGNLIFRYWFFVFQGKDGSNQVQKHIFCHIGKTIFLLEEQPKLFSGKSSS